MIENCLKYVNHLITRSCSNHTEHFHNVRKESLKAFILLRPVLPSQSTNPLNILPVVSSRFERRWIETNNRICSVVKPGSSNFVVFLTWKSLQRKFSVYPLALLTYFFFLFLAFYSLRHVCFTLMVFRLLSVK
jgi:hypothetical protein